VHVSTGGRNGKEPREVVRSAEKVALPAQRQSLCQGEWRGEGAGGRWLTVMRKKKATVTKQNRGWGSAPLTPFFRCVCVGGFVHSVPLVCFAAIVFGYLLVFLLLLLGSLLAHLCDCAGMWKNELLCTCRGIDALLFHDMNNPYACAYIYI
jgi:hypothetical protein